MIGALLSGGCYIPVNIETPLNKLLRLVALVDPDVIVADPALMERLAATSPRSLRVDPTRLMAGETMSGPGPRNVTAYITLTSGSTGAPKGVVIPNTALAHYVDWLCDAELFAPGAPCGADRHLFHRPHTA